MPDLIDQALSPDPRDAEFWTRYLITCAALGVKPVSVERGKELFAEWSDAMAGATSHKAEDP